MPEWIWWVLGIIGGLTAVSMLLGLIAFAVIGWNFVKGWDDFWGW